MNKVILMGRLTRDPEIRYVQTDKSMAIASMSIAVDRRFKKEEDTVTADFFNLRAFGKMAEFAGKYLKKGTKIVVSGRLQNDNYTNKDGIKVYSFQIIVEEIEFAESKKAAGENSIPVSQESGGKSIDDEFINIPDGIDTELPFH